MPPIGTLHLATPSRPRSRHRRSARRHLPEPGLGFDGGGGDHVGLRRGRLYARRYTLPWSGSKDRGAENCHAEQPGRALLIQSPPTGGRALILYFVSESPTAGVRERRSCEPSTRSTSFATACPRGLHRLLSPPLCWRLPFLGRWRRWNSYWNNRLRCARPSPFFRVATDGSIQQVPESHSRPDRAVSFLPPLSPTRSCRPSSTAISPGDDGASDHDIAVPSSRPRAMVVRRWAGTRTRMPIGALVVAAVPTYEPSAGARLGSHCKQPHHPRLFLPMPLHISRLHAAWQQRSQSKPAEPVRSMICSTKSSCAPAQVERSQRPHRCHSRLFLSATVASTDRALAALLLQPVSERIRYVGLFFTDPQDKLFLADQVRRYAPDTVLFTFESDLTTPHPRFARCSQGHADRVAPVRCSYATSGGVIPSADRGTGSSSLAISTRAL